MVRMQGRGFVVRSRIPVRFFIAGKSDRSHGIVRYLGETGVTKSFGKSVFLVPSSFHFPASRPHV